MTELQIKLTPDQALVIFEWLSAREDELRKQAPDSALSPEEIALAAISGQLEKALAEPFAPNYAELVEAARTRLLNS